MKRTANHYQRELEVALEAARKAGDILLRHYQGGTKAWEKSEGNPVTLADLESERAITAHLSAAFPDFGILSEETASTPERLEKSCVWIVDPMDGTKEFTQRIPEFAASIALAEEGEPVVGVIHNPVTRVTVCATRGGGTFRDGERTHISTCRELAQARVVASRSEIGRGEFEPYQGWFRALQPVGSIAWKLALVASGSDYADLNISVAPKNEWDVCAGDLLIREAGGLYLDFAGQRRIYNQPVTLIDCGMAAGPSALLDAFFEREQARSS